MTLRTKLLLAPAPLWLALVLVGTLAVADLEELGRTSQDMLRDNLVSVLAVRRMTESLEGLNRDAVLLLQGGGGALPHLEDRRRTFEEALKEQERSVVEQGEAEATASLSSSWRNHLALLEGYAAAAGRSDIARRYYFERLLPSFLAVKAAADRIVAINQAAMLLKAQSAQHQADSTRATMAAVAVAALLSGLLASMALTTQMLRPLSVLSQAVVRIGGGDFGARVRLDSRDEIAALAREVNSMAERLSLYRQSSLGELLLAQQAAQSAIDSLPDPVLIFNTEGKLISCNQAAETLRQRGADCGEGLEGLESALGENLRPLLARVLANKGPYLPQGFEDAMRLGGAEGERYLLPRAVPVVDPSGLLAGVTILLQDVTRLRLFDQVKSDLVATVAHEFRTPLTSLRMAIYLCLEGVPGPLTPKQSELLSAARSDCERVQAMVDDLLDLSRISEGGLKMRTLPLPADELVQSAILTHSAAAERAGVRLTAELPLTPERVRADPERLALVFSNLITNALRHTPAEGLVSCGARAENQFARFWVKDSGPGIASEHLERVFDKFYGLPGPQGGGPGLGLYIAREVVRAHGGEIGAESAPNQGSRFWFTIPLA